MKQPISIIIPTMNRPESLNRTLCGLANGINIPNQVIIVDQSIDQENRDGTKRIALSYSEKFGNVVYLFLATPSITKARNLGITQAINDILVFSDDDVDVEKNTISNIVDIMKDENIALIAGIDELAQKSKTNIGYLLGTKSFFKRKLGHVTKSMLGRYPDNVIKQTDTEWAQGYFFVLRKHLQEQWELQWDENLLGYAYAEDLDFSYSYCKQAKRTGYRCIIDPKVKVKHLASIEYRIPTKKTIQMYIIHRTYLGNKHNMGPVGHLARNWSDFWRLVEALLKRKNTMNYIHALFIKLKFYKSIKQGKFYFE